MNNKDMKEISLSHYKIAADYIFDHIPEGRITVNTINAYSWVMADKDPVFCQSLKESDYLLPDGVSVVWAANFVEKAKIHKIAGADLHQMVLETLNKEHGKCFYLGSTETTLSKIRQRLSKEFPNIQVKTFSPPFKATFTKEDNKEMIEIINDFAPDALFVGMTAPKQEKWIHENKLLLNAHITCGIGAVFDFYAGTVKRPPQWMINIGLEWFGRLIGNPKRLWKRYIVYNPVFVWKIIKLRFGHIN